MMRRFGAGRRVSRRGLLGLPLLALASPANAHSELRRSDPASGAVLAATPGRLLLEFNEPVRLTAVRLHSPGGRELALPERRTIREARQEEVRLPPLEPGAYRVEWRAISADGHPVGGTIAFRVAPP